MLEELNERNAELQAEIDSLIESRETLTGANKAKVTQKIKLLKESLSGSSSKVKTSKAVAKVVTASPVAEASTMLVVVNLSNYMKVDPLEKTRFSPNLETATKRTGWITSQIEAGLFKEVSK